MGQARRVGNGGGDGGGCGRGDVVYILYFINNQSINQPIQVPKASDPPTAVHVWATHKKGEAAWIPQPEVKARPWGADE